MSLQVAQKKLYRICKKVTFTKFYLKVVLKRRISDHPLATIGYSRFCPLTQNCSSEHASTCIARIRTALRGGLCSMVEVDWVDPLLSVILLFQTLFGFVVNLYVLIFVILTKQVKHFERCRALISLVIIIQIYDGCTPINKASFSNNFRFLQLSTIV